MTDAIRKRLQQIQERGDSLDREIESLSKARNDQREGSEEVLVRDSGLVASSNSSPQQQIRQQQDSSSTSATSTYDDQFYVRQGVDNFLFQQQKDMRDRIVASVSNLTFLRRQLYIPSFALMIEVEKNNDADKNK